jgi:hypothetical protein
MFMLLMYLVNCRHQKTAGTSTENAAEFGHIIHVVWYAEASIDGVGLVPILQVTGHVRRCRKDISCNIELESSC